MHLWKRYIIHPCGESQSLSAAAWRHGIVLASTSEAKKFGIKTGDAAWQARQKCRDLIVVEPHMDRYVRFSKAARDIYSRYFPCVEPFGLDESWLDLTGTAHLFGGAETVANEIRQTIRQELGVTVSIGVSFNKSIAKLGSDYKKPDATTVITRENFKDLVWPLPTATSSGWSGSRVSPSPPALPSGLEMWPPG